MWLVVLYHINSTTLADICIKDDVSICIHLILITTHLFKQMYSFSLCKSFEAGKCRAGFALRGRSQAHC